MSAMTWEPIAIVASLWFAAGMTCASILYRRGHEGWHWMFACGLAGPLAFHIVVNQARAADRDGERPPVASTGRFVDPSTTRASLRRSKSGRAAASASRRRQ